MKMFKIAVYYYLILLFIMWKKNIAPLNNCKRWFEIKIHVIRLGMDSSLQLDILRLPLMNNLVWLIVALTKVKVLYIVKRPESVSHHRNMFPTFFILIHWYHLIYI